MLNYSAATSFILKIALFNLRGIVFVGKKTQKTTKDQNNRKIISATGICQQSPSSEISASACKIHIPCTEYWIQQAINAINLSQDYFVFQLSIFWFSNMLSVLETQSAI